MTSRDIGRAAIALFGAALLGLIVVRVTSTPILLGRGHAAIALLSPDDPAVVLRVAEREFANNGAISDATFSRVRAASLQAPLAEEPFLFAAVRAPSGAERLRLLEEARRRNPRMRLARLLLIEQYIRAGRIDEAAVEIKVLNGLFSDASSLFIEQLARLAADPATRPALQRAIGGDPVLDHVLVQLVNRGAASALIMDLAQPRMRAYSPAQPPEWQRLLVTARVGAGQFGEARQLWQRFNRIDSPPNGLYNPTFAELPGGPPFNWTLLADAAGVAEAARGGALDILYFGRDDAELARQLVMLRPGRYRLQLAASSDDQPGGSRLFWQVSCAPANQPLARVGLDELTSRPRALRAEFEVPASGCPAQWIRLVGEASEFPTRREVRVVGLALNEVGRTQ